MACDDPFAGRTGRSGARRCLTRLLLVVALHGLTTACAGNGGWPKLAGPLPETAVPPPPALAGPVPQPIVRFADDAAARSWLVGTERRIKTWQDEIATLSVRDLPARIRPDDLKLWGEAETRLTRLHRIEAELLEADLRREAAESRLVAHARDEREANVWRTRLARLADRLHRMAATVATHRQALESRLGGA